MQNCQLTFSPKIQYQLAADLPAGKAGRSEAASNSLRFSKMWSILEIVRTVFAPQAARYAPSENPKMRLRRADKNCQRTCKNIGSNCILILGKENF